MPDAAPVAAPSAPAPAALPAPAPSSPPSTASAPAAPPSAAAPDSGAPASTPPAAAPPPKTYKRTINGQPVEIPANMGVEELAKSYGIDVNDFLRGPDLMRAAYAKHEEVAKLRKEIERQQAEAKRRFEDPRITEIKAQNPGMDDEDAAALLRVQELYNRSQQTPEQRALAEERAKREELERKIKAGEDEKSQAQLEAETKGHIEKFQREIPEAAAKYGLPRSPAWGRSMLDHMAAMLRQGRPVDAMEAAHFVKEQVRSTDRARFTEMDPGAVVEWLGQDIVKKILQHEVQRVKGGGQPQVAAAPAPPVPAAPKNGAPEHLTTEEWRKRFAADRFK